MARIRRYEVVVKPDGNRWSAYCPVLLEKGGAAAFGKTRGEALKILIK